MAADQFGTKLEVGVGETIPDYIISRITRGGSDVHMSDVRDEDGKRASRFVKDLDPKVELELIALSNTDPETDFATGKPCTATAFNNFWVDDQTNVRDEDEMKVSVSLTDIGFVS